MEKFKCVDAKQVIFFAWPKFQKIIFAHNLIETVA